MNAGKSLEYLAGKVLCFYGVDENRFSVSTVDTGARHIFEAIEGESKVVNGQAIVDLEDITNVKQPDHLIFFPRAIAVVELYKIDDELYALRDRTNHTWLTFGTETCDYGGTYSLFVFRYSPGPNPNSL